MKQETPEEAAEKLYPMVGNEYLWHIPIQRREGFIAGAKWQQERSYSEEEVKFIISEALQSALVNSNLELWFNIFKKKQNESNIRI